MKKYLILPVLILSLCYSSNAQSYQAGHMQVTFTDLSRGGRSIQTEIYYPAAVAGNGVPASNGSFPLIIFGHGFLMAWDAYENIWNDLMPQGYILAFPRTEGNISPNHSEFGKDLSFLVTKIQSAAATDPGFILFNHVSFRSAVMGHSMGGGASLLAAENNTTITTLVNFAAANTSPSSIDAARNVTIPALIFSGENDCVAPPLQHQIPMYDSLNSACKAYVNIRGAAHCEFAEFNFNCSFGQSSCSPQPTISGEEQKDAVTDLLKLWLEYYLKDNCSAIGAFRDTLALSSRYTSAIACQDGLSPTITQAGRVLQSSPAVSYQWYFNGAVLSGETSQSISATMNGNYYVSVTHSASCPAISNIINFQATGIISENIQSRIQTYPNPAKDNIHLKMNGIQGKFGLKLTDVAGNSLMSGTFHVNGEDIVIDVQNLTSGTYLIDLRSEKTNYQGKFIKQ